MTKDASILRDLAKRYAEIAAKPWQKTRRDLWRKSNSFKGESPLVYIRSFAFSEMPDSKCLCEDKELAGYEKFFRNRIFWDTFNDDSIFEPWLTVEAEYECTGWGIRGVKHYTEEVGCAYKEDYPIKELDDVKKMRMPWHKINEKVTAERVSKIKDIVGDIIAIDVDRASCYRMWTGDLSCTLGHLRGIENIMMDMMDNSEWLHSLVKYMSDGVMKANDEAEAAGDWGLSASQNQAMPYAEEVKDPAPNVRGIKRKDIWGYMAAQEFTCVSPEMHEEFLLQYQLPIISKFGLSAYGCCEDLTNKIDMLRKIPNLRRIAASPFVNLAKCVEKIGRDYIISYRPNPADMVSYDFNEERIRSILRRDFQILKGTHFDITLKDVETVEKDTNRVRRWVQIVREEVEKNL